MAGPDRGGRSRGAADVSTEQERRWYRHNPNGADAVAAATKATGAARERTAEYLLVTRLEQLREQGCRPGRDDRQDRRFV
ncbi:hypothetical protein [Streptomyces sp. NRRL F-5755]|uniref:hypothetical protein n=1 Tax=Streptomyces sp. NRRL F-5755 TaxID=1519475 RepID=UPI001F4516DD|nr:hypothetical protein [Streptomyces sp. NRRL F-5755]